MKVYLLKPTQGVVFVFTLRHESHATANISFDVLTLSNLAHIRLRNAVKFIFCERNIASIKNAIFV